MTWLMTDEVSRESLLRQYLTVAGATLGQTTDPDALVLAMTRLITQDLARLIQTPNPNDIRSADSAPVDIPVLDTKSGQTIIFTFGGNCDGSKNE